MQTDNKKLWTEVTLTLSLVMQMFYHFVYLHLLLLFPQTLIIFILFLTEWAHNHHVLQLSCKVFSFTFSLLCFLACCFSLLLLELQNNNVLNCTCNWVVLSQLLLHISLPCGCIFVHLNKCVCARALIYVGVCQCLQRIWKRASGRWRGSCCSWRETWRLSPPLMTPMTCSSLKWLYPLHTHAFTCVCGNYSGILL